MKVLLSFSCHKERRMIELLDENGAAAYLRLKRQTLSAWRCHHQGPPFVRVGRLVRYRKGDLDAWLDKQTVLMSVDDPPGQ
jgi:excisionase family DNA binding protein